MTILSCLAAAFTFTASATGVGKGSTVEFLFIGSDSDRDYEAMFTIDMPIADFAKAVEKAGLKPGMPIDPPKCQVWPVGTPVAFEPEISRFVAVDASEGFSLGRIVYTGGLRGSDGAPVAAKEMPASVCSLYSLGQSLFLPEGILSQGDVYGRFTAKESLKKGEKYAFTLSWNDADTPRHIDMTVKPGEEAELIRQLKDEAMRGSIDVLVAFDASLTVAEATQFAKALELVDSVRVKINGCRPGSLFYRAFLPLVKWTDRQNRMVQPFELTMRDNDEELLFIEEDWTVEGDDPKLTPKPITYEKALALKKTDTCFIYAAPETKLSRIYAAMKRLSGSSVYNWYIFPKP